MSRNWNYLNHNMCMCPDCTMSNTDMRSNGYIVPAGFPENRVAKPMPEWFRQQLAALPDTLQRPDDASQYVWHGVTA